jgi:hypothetical protein
MRRFSTDSGWWLEAGNRLLGADGDNDICRRSIAMIAPTEAFFTKGVGFHKNELQSYELALREARIEKQNSESSSFRQPSGSCRVAFHSFFTASLAFSCSARCSSIIW